MRWLGYRKGESFAATRGERRRDYRVWDWLSGRQANVAPFGDVPLDDPVDKGWPPARFSGWGRSKGAYMRSFAQQVRRFLVAEDGPTAVEYAVMLALIIIVCLTAIASVGTNANTTFQNVAGSLATGS
jgi:pilus assembly protein Flp/PilA